MKHFPIKKSKKRTKPFIPEGTRSSLPKPKIPFMVIWNSKKIDGIYLGWKD